MILIIDQEQNWSFFETPSLQLKRSGTSSHNLPVQGVSLIGIIVTTLSSAEPVIKADLVKKGSLDSKDHELVELIKRRFKKLPIWLISDNAFFNSLPVSSSLILGPVTTKRQGRSGLTHAYLVEETARRLGRSPLELNLITLDLGEESTVTAIKDGVAVEVSTSGSLLDGLPGARGVGSIDAELVFDLIKKEGWERAYQTLTEKSGLLGFSELGPSLAAVISKPKLRQNPKFTLALKVYLHRLLLYLGAYAAMLGRVDGVVFSGSLGFNSSFIREDLTRSLATLRLVNILNVEAKPHLLAAEILHHQS